MDLNGSKWIQMDLNGSNGSKLILATLRSCCEVGIKDFFDLVYLIFPYIFRKSCMLQTYAR